MKGPSTLNQVLHLLKFIAQMLTSPTPMNVARALAAANGHVDPYPFGEPPSFRYRAFYHFTKGSVPSWARLEIESRGAKINRRAELGSRIIALQEQVMQLEKLSRKTPPRTLIGERARVAEAKRLLIPRLDELVRVRTEYTALRNAGY